MQGRSISASQNQIYFIYFFHCSFRRKLQTNRYPVSCKNHSGFVPLYGREYMRCFVQKLASGPPFGRKNDQTRTGRPVVMRGLLPDFYKIYRQVICLVSQWHFIPSFYLLCSGKLSLRWRVKSGILKIAAFFSHMFFLRAAVNCDTIKTRKDRASPKVRRNFV